MAARVVQPAAELLVAFLLIALGVTVLARRGRAEHTARGDPHRAFGFGMAHGLAGSGAVVVLLVAAAPTRLLQGLYFGAFGGGTLAGMLLASSGVAAVAAAAARAGERPAHWIHTTTATVSVAVGVLLVLETARRL